MNVEYVYIVVWEAGLGEWDVYSAHRSVVKAEQAAEQASKLLPDRHFTVYTEELL